jgi:uncharacterized repeat protein (TIGR02543 family)
MFALVAAGISFIGATSVAEAGTTPCGSTGSFSSSSCSYTATGQDSFTVPDGITSLVVVAEGGAGDFGGSAYGTGGGDGAQVTADIPVTPGNTEDVEVGVGGGAGGYGYITRGGSADGGPGGGLSGVYSCPGDGTNPSCALLVAGGGGGGGTGGLGGDGGTGGLVCNPGDAGTGNTFVSGGGGGGCSAGGSAGVTDPAQLEGKAGGPGSGGGGGSGANIHGGCALYGYCLFGGGGGGGAGYYGGGGGAGSDGGGGGGGGGGSSFAEANASNVSMVSDSGVPSVTIMWASHSDDYSYTANGGTGSAPASGSGPDGTTVTLAANTFSYPGYVFAGWSDGTASYGAGGTYTLSSGGAPIVFTAQWTENPLDTVAFNSDGGAAVSSLSGPDGGSIALPRGTYPGYSFDGWFTAASGGNEVGGAGSSYNVPAGGTTLYAQWSENPIDTVAFNSDGGAAVSSLSGPDGSSITLPSDTYPGFSFEGWFTAASGGNKVGAPGWSFTVPAGGATLYAQWIENEIDTVYFISEGGAAVHPMAGPDGSSITLPTDTYPGYSFDGWFTAATGGNKVGGFGSSFTIPEPGVELYAQWSENPIDTVAFNADGGAAVSSISGPDGGSIILPSDTYPGYSFDGWFTQAAGGTLVGGAGSSYTVPSGGIALYAQWISITKFTPTSGPVGTVVIIKGTNLLGTTKVAFNGVKGTITKGTASKIKVVVPAGASTGEIKVVTPSGKVKTATSFTVT